jgi:glycosyltransferase involved in cell wall biosynthesis
MVDKLIITNLASFYKVYLYNELNKHCKLLVVYTNDHSEGRNSDFYKREMNFDHMYLHRSTIVRIFQLCRILCRVNYKELILGGWDSLSLWICAFLSPRKKNSLVVESSYLESTTRGIKGFVKRLFVSRISKVYASGRAQRKITDNLGFKGCTKITKGVGIFNYIKQPAYVDRQEVKNFLYVGRLTKVKNLEYLVERFNNHPELNLTIIGFGELEDGLRARANANVRFLGAINNSDLSQYYQNADVFILPSIAEPWGLVVEEALNNGTPIMVSDRVGCAEEIINSKNGVIFSLKPDTFEEQLAKIRDVRTYNEMRKYISTMDFEIIEQQQVDSYL